MLIAPDLPTPPAPLVAVLTLDGLVRAASSPSDAVLDGLVAPPGAPVRSPLLLEALAAARAGSPFGAVRGQTAAGPCRDAVDIDWVLLRDAAGVPDGLAAVARTAPADRERRQQDIFDALSVRAGDLALIADPEGHLLYVSPAVRHMLGYEAEDVVARTAWDFVHPDDVAAGSAVYRGVVQRGGTDTSRLRVRAADGSWRAMAATATNLLDSPVRGVVCNLQDVTEQVNAETALRRSEERHRAIADMAQEGIWAVTPAGDTLYANARMAALLGVELEVLHQRRVTDLLQPEQVPQMQQRLRERSERGSERYELRYRHPDGGERILVVAATPLVLPDGTVEGSLAMVSDVTAARQTEEELRRAALHDSLTGLPNRALLLDRLEHALARESVGTAVLLFDLDQFKLVNDSWGHAAGDELLVAVADRLRATARPGATVARFGGDEFVVVCEDVDEQQALRQAEDLLAGLGEPFSVSDRRMHVGASVGVAVSPPAVAGELLRYADAAMYAAKGAGRRRARLFDCALSEEAEQRWVVARELSEALSREELRLHYQPVVELRTGRVLGVEALARWDSARLGPVPPGRFVPVAELTGLGGELDAFAVGRALRDAADLRACGALPPDAYVAVNVSARSLSDGALEGVVMRAVEATGTPPGLVVLEITEGAIVDDAERAAGVLQRLRDRGLAVAVDDFGTGYSSLAYLRDLPISCLKVDRSFVSGIGEDSDALAIVASIVDLARAVGVDVVAEGVETAGQAQLLRRLGCAGAQGWLWSRALPVERVRAAQWSTGFGPARSVSARAPRAGARRGSTPAGPEHGLDRLLALHAEGASLATIAAALNGEGFRTPDGLRWHRTTVARAVAAAAYPQLEAGSAEPG